MKQYVITALLATALFASQAVAQNAIVVAPRSSATHEIPTIDTDRGNDADAAKVNYVTGGIGDDERTAIEAEKGSYNVHITNSSTNGAFVEDTTVVIKDKAGLELLNVVAGPLLYVQLPAGTYVITATHHEDTKTQRVTIGKKSKGATPHFAWKIPGATTSEE